MLGFCVQSHKLYCRTLLYLRFQAGLCESLYKSQTAIKPLVELKNYSVFPRKKFKDSKVIIIVAFSYYARILISLITFLHHFLSFPPLLERSRSIYRGAMLRRKHASKTQRKKEGRRRKRMKINWKNAERSERKEIVDYKQLSNPSGLGLKNWRIESES